MVKKKYTAKTADPHELYEKSVQCPGADIDFVIRRYKKATGEKPRFLKEDFCGTAAAACEFVKRHKDNRAIGVDLEPSVLAWGREHNLAKLNGRAANITLCEANVLEISEPQVDVTLAMNFSYYLFKEREDLQRYFRAAHAGLKPGGMFFLDAYGGSEAQVVLDEKRKLKGFTYIWDQASFDPITNEATNYIHFTFPDGTRQKRAFAYDWRLWSLREVTDLLREVGFAEVDVYWEGWDKKNETGSGIFKKTRHAENCEGWVAYVVARREPLPVQ